MKKKNVTFAKNIKTACLVLGIGALTLVSGTFASGCAGDRYHESTGEGIDDSATTARVKSALSSDKQFKYDDVKVTTFKGTVQLSGFVDSRDARSHATEITQDVPGVKKLKNNITVKD